jgi:hypothetical protein
LTGAIDGHSNSGAGSVVTAMDNELIVAAGFGTNSGIPTSVTAVGLTHSLTLLPTGALTPGIVLAYDLIASAATTNVQMTGATNVWEVFATFNKNISMGSWGLVQLQSDPPQINALLGDTRVVYAGTVWDTPPSAVLSVYSNFVLGTETLMGQVLNRLGNNLDPRFLPQ